MFYTRDGISRINNLYDNAQSPVQTAMFYTRGNGRQCVKPGVILDDCQKELDRNYIIGMGIIENILNPPAKITLQTKLAQAHYDGYAAIQAAGWRYGNLQQQQKLGKATNLPTFNSQSGTLSVKPGTQEYENYVEQNRVAGLNQTRLDKDQALIMSSAQGIGNFNKSSKHKILIVGNRSADELVTNNFREF